MDTTARGILLISLLLITGAAGASTDDEEWTWNGNHYVAVGGGVVVFICLAAALALCTETVQPVRGAPSWVMTIQPDPALINEGFRACSDGMNIINPQCVQRTRRGAFETDGARWSAPLSKGRHVFEIFWPVPMRGTLATVGVGIETAPLFVKPRDSLVGCNGRSWGLDIARRRVLHDGKMVCSLPVGGVIVPDKFYMYVDCDAGTVGWGTEGNYWGAPVTIPMEKLPVYVMVGVLQAGAQVTVVYRGSASNQPALQTVMLPQQVVVVANQMPSNPAHTQVTVVNPTTVQTDSYPPPAENKPTEPTAPTTPTEEKKEGVPE